MSEQFRVPWNPKCATAGLHPSQNREKALPCVALTLSLGHKSFASSGGSLCKIEASSSVCSFSCCTHCSDMNPWAWPGQPPQSSPSSCDGALSFLSCKSSYVNRCLFFQFISAFVGTLLVSNNRHQLEPAVVNKGTEL